MDNLELAKQLLNNLFLINKCGLKKKFIDNMQGEALTMLYMFRHKKIVLPSEISNDMNISSARVAAMLNSLDNKELVTREIDTSDRRRIIVKLTEKGKEIAERNSQEIENHAAKILELLGEHDAKELVRITEKLVKLSTEIEENKC